MGAGETPQQRLQRLDPKRLFGQIKAPTPAGGILRGGNGGITQDSTETVRRCLEVSFLMSAYTRTHMGHSKAGREIRQATTTCSAVWLTWRDAAAEAGRHRETPGRFRLPRTPNAFV